MPRTAIRVASGRLVDLADFKPEDALLTDIAAGLAHQERFNGHSPLHPTIAQHSLAVEHIAQALMPDELYPEIGPIEAERVLGRAALMHDAAEAYVGDVSAPAKRRMRDIYGHGSSFDFMEEDVQGAVNYQFDCAPDNWASVVHEADLLAYRYESCYMSWNPDPEGGPPPAWVEFDLYVRRCYGTPDGGRAAFLRRAHALGMYDYPIYPVAAAAA